MKQLLSAGRIGLPMSRRLRVGQRWEASEVHTVELGTMLGHVIIVPSNINHVSLVDYRGDERMIDSLRVSVRKGVLKIKGKLPFKPGFGDISWCSKFCNNDVITRCNGSFLTTNLNRQYEYMVFNERQIDPSRSIRLILFVPFGTNVRVDDVVGKVNINSGLGALDFNNVRFATCVFACDVTKLTSNIRSQCYAKVGLVHGKTDIRVSHQDKHIASVFALGSVGGEFNAYMHGHGIIRVEGGESSFMRAHTVSNRASIDHYGTVCLETQSSMP